MNEFVRRAVRISIARAGLQEETAREAEKVNGKKWWENGYN